jgi:hypothetical protein
LGCRFVEYSLHQQQGYRQFRMSRTGQFVSVIRRLVGVQAEPHPTISPGNIDYINCILSAEDEAHLWGKHHAQGRVCGLVFRVLGYRSRDPGSIPGTTRLFLEVVCLEQGPLSLVSTTIELV